MNYRRILLKLSGEALLGNQNYGIDQTVLSAYISEIKSLVNNGVQVGIVIGGGNIFRGMQGVDEGVDRVKGDYMGMMATIINSVALQGEFEKQGVNARLLSGIAVEPIAEKMYGPKAVAYLEEGSVVIMAGGTGNPFFTTDTASALRAVEINADAIFKGTRVDGVYTSDPEKDKDAKKYDSLSFDEALEKELRIMDQTAFALCKENDLQIVVFNMNKIGNLLKLVKGEKIGTVVSNA